MRVGSNDGGNGGFYLIYHVLELAIKDFHIETETILIQDLDVMHQMLRLRDALLKASLFEKISTYDQVLEVSFPIKIDLLSNFYHPGQYGGLQPEEPDLRLPRSS